MTPHPEPQPEAEPTIPACERIVIYDGECRMCVTAKQGLERVGEAGGTRFVPYQSAEAASRLGEAYRPGRPDVAFLVEADGTVRPGLDAFLPLLRGLPGGRALVAAMRFRLVRRLAEWAYRVVACHRYRWFGTVKRERDGSS